MPEESPYDAERLTFVAVATIDELGDGERLLFEVDEFSVALFKIDGGYYAIADVCSHDNGPVGEGEIDGHEIVCPRHGARFDLRNGKALTLPAVEDISAYPVRVEGDQILVGLPLN